MLLVLGCVLGGVTLILVIRGLMFDRLQGGQIIAHISAYTGGGQQAEGNEPRNALLDSLAIRLGGRFAKMFDQEEARKQIMAAGVYSLTPQRLIGYRLLATGGPPLIWILLSVSSHPSPVMFLAGLALTSVGGWRLPVMHLQRKAKTRLAEIDYNLPTLVDTLVVTVEAGVSFGGSLQIAAERQQGPLRDELKLTLKEQQMGLTIGEALKNFQGRCPTPTVTAFVRALSQTEQLGVSLGKILRDLSDDMRKRRKAMAEERANKAPIKMLFPLVFLIFPSMLSILLGPAVLQLLKMFSQGG